jgi:hypothetical protein
MFRKFTRFSQFQKSLKSPRTSLPAPGGFRTFGVTRHRKERDESHCVLRKEAGDSRLLIALANAARGCHCGPDAKSR